jgi:exodeoxyribonuclease-3
MNIVTWNVNSIRSRESRVIAWLTAHQPDVLCLQELKLEDSLFPHAAIESLGYHAVTHGQKTYNGVAILSRHEITDVTRTLDDGVDDPQARLIAGTVRGVRVVCVYVPNGGEPDSDKYAYKLAWYKRLRQWFEREGDAGRPMVLCGDMNVAPDARDVARPNEWNDTVLCLPEARGALQHVLDWGLEDAFRQHRIEAGLYSWWDYRGGGFERDNGLRIDHVFATKAMTSIDAFVDRNERRGDKASDHVPLGVVFADI